MTNIRQRERLTAAASSQRESEREEEKKRKTDSLQVRRGEEKLAILVTTLIPISKLTLFKLVRAKSTAD